MSAEERLVSQLDGIVTSVIKALESLEKKLSEYVEVTNKRLQILEEKVQNFESLADVSGKGLVKAIESSPSQEKVKELAHLATQNKTITGGTNHTITPSTRNQTSIIHEPNNQSNLQVSIPISTRLVNDKTDSVQIPESRTPLIPIPTSPKPVKEEIIPPTPLMGLSEKDDNSQKAPSAKRINLDKDEKEDEDKDELMSALKVIDSL